MSDGTVVATSATLTKLLKQLFPSQNNQATWAKLLTLAATTTGSAIIAYIILSKTRRQSCSTTSKLNGHVKTKIQPVYSRARNELEFTPEEEGQWGDAIDAPVVGTSSSNAFYDCNDSSWSRGVHTIRRRQRTDSLTSTSTTLLITARSPSELMLYGMEALKRSIRLFEETRNQLVLTDDSFGSVSRENSADSELEFILCKAKQLCDDVESYYRENLLTSATSPKSINGASTTEDTNDGSAPPLLASSPVNATTNSNSLSLSSPVGSMMRSSSNLSIATTLTLPFFDIEPNIHFFKLYTCAFDELNSILPPRTDRSKQLKCDSYNEFLAKVSCIRHAFSHILSNEENVNWFTQIGQDILEIVLKHSPRDPAACLDAYSDLIKFTTEPGNVEKVETEIAHRKIPSASFYDLVIDYMILESFDDLDNPPSAVMSVANNRWLSSGFRELALQTAVSAVLKHKRSKLPVKEGFFDHFYNILEYISPILAWGFLGTDSELKLKVNLMKDSIMQVLRGYFSFDRVRYTSINDLSDDILRITDEEYERLMKLLNASNV